jgi:hypothetical protein
MATVYSEDHSFFFFFNQETNALHKGKAAQMQRTEYHAAGGRLAWQGLNQL